MSELETPSLFTTTELRHSIIISHRERKLREGGYSESVSTALRELGRIKSVEVELNDQWFRFRTEASPEVSGILKALGYRLPSRVEPLPSLE
jgi:hypothetical protein